MLEWVAISFSTPVNQVLSKFFTVSHPFGVALPGTAHDFIELCKPLHYDKAVICEGGEPPLPHGKSYLLLVEFAGQY